MPRQRPQITNEEVIKFLSKYPDDAPVFCSISEVNLDEPEETQEFVLHEERKKCVAIETNGRSITFGFANES